MSFFDPISSFNRQPSWIPKGHLPPKPLPVGKASSSPSKIELRRLADRLNDQVDRLYDVDGAREIADSLDLICQDLDRLAKLAG